MPRGANKPESEPGFVRALCEHQARHLLSPTGRHKWHSLSLGKRGSEKGWGSLAQGAAGGGAGRHTPGGTLDTLVPVLPGGRHG